MPITAIGIFQYFTLVISQSELTVIISSVAEAAQA